MVDFILYFTAEWCDPCKITRPIVEELNADGLGPRFFIIDEEDSDEMLPHFVVNDIPTFILIKDNSEIARFSGSRTRDELKELMDYEAE